MASPTPLPRLLGVALGSPDDGGLAADAAFLGSLPKEQLESLVALAAANAGPGGGAGGVALALEEVDAWSAGAGVKRMAGRAALRTLLLIFAAARSGRGGGGGPALETEAAAAGLPLSVAAAAGAAWAVTGPRLATSAALEAAPSAAAPLLAAAWRLGVTTATDDVGRVGSAFVTLRLTLGGAAGAPATDEVIELTVGQFYDLLAEREYLLVVLAGS